MKTTKPIRKTRPIEKTIRELRVRYGNISWLVDNVRLGREENFDHRSLAELERDQRALLDAIELATDVALSSGAQHA